MKDHIDSVHFLRKHEAELHPAVFFDLAAPPKLLGETGKGRSRGATKANFSSTKQKRTAGQEELNQQSAPEHLLCTYTQTYPWYCHRMV